VIPLTTRKSTVVTLLHLHYSTLAMSFHPTGITVDIVGIESNTQGRSCEEHDICGKSSIAEDAVVRFRKVQIVVNGKEESAIAAYHVSDGIDRCRVGFLKRHLLKHWKRYDGVLAQVIEVYSKESDSPTKRKNFYHNKGCCVAAIISSLPDDAIPQVSQQKRSAKPDDDNSTVKRQKSAADCQAEING
jgi:hypothetical protein